MTKTHIQKPTYLFLLALCCFFGLSVNAQKIKVAVAANTQFAMKELAATFTEQEKIQVDLIIGSSGKLAAQINHGAPYHIFISANTSYAQFICDEGYAVEEPEIYASGTGVLWTTKDIDLSSRLKTLLKESVETIAIASPKNAPYGVLAVEALNGANIYSQIKNKVILGSSISQVNQYISLGTVDVGITSKSTVLSPKMIHIGKWVELKGFSIDQAMVRLTHSVKDNEQSTIKFYNFLKSEKAKKIFVKHGYIVD